jgi:hypothetical protein
MTPVPEGIISTSTGPVDPNAEANSVNAVATEVSEETPAVVQEVVQDLVEEELPEAEADDL